MANEKRLVDANALVQLLRGKLIAKYPCTFYFGLIAAADEIEKIPAVDAVEVVHGNWKYRMEYEDFVDADCSVCGNTSLYMYKYCPNCGAKMDGGKDNGKE